MSVVIRMKRTGRTNRPSFRISVADTRSKRDGRTIEWIGHYDPVMPHKDRQVSVDVERARYWLSKGAKASETVASIFRRLGVITKEDEKPAPPRDRSARKAPNKSRDARAQAKGARLAAKADRLKSRLAAKKAAKAAGAEKKDEAKA